MMILRLEADAYDLRYKRLTDVLLFLDYLFIIYSEARCQRAFNGIHFSQPQEKELPVQHDSTQVAAATMTDTSTDRTNQFEVFLEPYLRQFE